MKEKKTHTVVCDVCGEKYVGPPGEDVRIFCDEHPKTHPEVEKWESYYDCASNNAHLRPVPPRKKLETHYPKGAYGYCHECEELQHWDVTHGFVPYHGLCHILKCEECGVEIPEFAFARYVSTGKLVIPV